MTLLSKIVVAAVMIMSAPWLLCAETHSDVVDVTPEDSILKEALDASLGAADNGDFKSTDNEIDAYVVVSDESVTDQNTNEQLKNSALEQGQLHDQRELKRSAALPSDNAAYASVFSVVFPCALLAGVYDIVRAVYCSSLATEHQNASPSDALLLKNS